MKYLLLFIFSIISYTVVIAQDIDWGKMDEKQKNKYLIELAKEVTKKFGPGYYRENVTPVITEATFNEKGKSEIYKKNRGRKYYIVTFPYDKSKEYLDYDYTSQVLIWKDSGEPLFVFFGNGVGRYFMHESYKKQTDGHTAINEIPYEQAQRPDSISFNDLVKRGIYKSK